MSQSGCCSLPALTRLHVPTQIPLLSLDVVPQWGDMWGASPPSEVAVSKKQGDLSPSCNLPEVLIVLSFNFIWIFQLLMKQ